ncbi:F0F1 ATP synthase subunit epsilon [Balneola sp. MJW-20]|uniref:F0F1 ATP synthase subunit epsilon n=1 Tax=Gracilimonas aurantiaca TaxID=3234185 RepID=UPI0034663629
MKRYNKIRLRVSEPTGILLESEADKIIAESVEGYFCLKPNHVDMTTILDAGLVAYSNNGEESYLATDEGLLVKCGNEVNIAVLHAVPGNNLEMLHRVIRKRYKLDEMEENEAMVSFNKLEADLINRFLELQKESGGHF